MAWMPGFLRMSRNFFVKKQNNYEWQNKSHFTAQMRQYISMASILFIQWLKQLLLISYCETFIHWMWPRLSNQWESQNVEQYIFVLQTSYYHCKHQHKDHSWFTKSSFKRAINYISKMQWLHFQKAKPFIHCSKKTFSKERYESTEIDRMNS